jgi:predicted acylesterase/phospholipase RssA
VKFGHQAPPGDDHTTVPPRVEEEPPAGRYCDLVMTGGVASGVVYPWAVVELARDFHFRQIGGTSVGAMAAVLAAAAEYGRRHGNTNAFEPLRRAPEQLAEELPDPNGRKRTRMLSLFQPSAAGRRVFELFVAGVDAIYERGLGGAGAASAVLRALFTLYRPEWCGGARAGAMTGAALGFVAVVLLALLAQEGPPWSRLTLLLGAAVVLLPALAFGVYGALRALLRALQVELRTGVVEHGYGLCAGAALDPAQAENNPGLTDWMHKGIQLSAGLTLDDPPLTFRELWRAPMEPGSDRHGGDAPGTRAIDLQMITTSVTHMRPHRLPLVDKSITLYFRPDELLPYFPPAVVAALTAGARPYVQRKPSEPPTEAGQGLYELPAEDLPVVVAARLSLSYPLLFAAVPLHAVDFEESGQRVFRRAWFSDGGLCSNFPLHLFDAALPTHPTFGLWLDERGPFHPREAVWLPERFIEGCGDSWQRFDPDSPPEETPAPGPAGRLFRFVVAAILTAKDWGDRTAMRMPHTRHRVARLFLRGSEGALNITMSRQRILSMAREYGTRTGRRFAERYAAGPGQPPTADWNRQRWVRLRVLVPALRGLLQGFGASVQGSAHATPVEGLIEQASRGDILLDQPPKPRVLTPEQAAAWRRAVAAASGFEAALQDPDLNLKLTGNDEPDPELRIRPRV